jgi:SAM-dependent methyltransferase
MSEATPTLPESPAVRGDKTDLAARYKRRSALLHRLLRPPAPLIHNSAEKLLPYCEGIKLFVGGAGGIAPSGFLNVDFLEVDGVDVVADVQHLPFRSDSVAAIDCDAVLEHVADAKLAVSELHRVLRPAGFLHVVVPFCQASHAYPSDYRRWTTQGLRELMHDFEIVDVGVRAGPTATLISFFLEYLKLPFAGVFGKTLYAAAGWILWPLRYLDLWLNTTPRAHVLAHAVYILARKRVPGRATAAGN